MILDEVGPGIDKAAEGSAAFLLSEHFPLQLANMADYVIDMLPMFLKLLAKKVGVAKTGHRLIVVRGWKWELRVKS